MVMDVQNAAWCPNLRHSAVMGTYSVTADQLRVAVPKHRTELGVHEHGRPERTVVFAEAPFWAFHVLFGRSPSKGLAFALAHVLSSRLMEDRWLPFTYLPGDSVRFGVLNPLHSTQCAYQPTLS